MLLNSFKWITVEKENGVIMVNYLTGKMTVNFNNITDQYFRLL